MRYNTHMPTEILGMSARQLYTGERPHFEQGKALVDLFDNPFIVASRQLSDPQLDMLHSLPLASTLATITDHLRQYPTFSFDLREVTDPNDMRAVLVAFDKQIEAYKKQYDGIEAELDTHPATIAMKYIQDYGLDNQYNRIAQDTAFTLEENDFGGERGAQILNAVLNLTTAHHMTALLQEYCDRQGCTLESLTEHVSLPQ